MALITPGHQELKGLGGNSAICKQLPVARLASGNVCETELRGWIALPTDRAAAQGAACVGSQQWSCLWSRPSVGPGSTSPWATTAVDWKLVMEGPALKERADKN